MSQPSFTSLVVTYNSAKEVLNLLSDLSTYVPDHPVIVIDNASSDETVHLIEEHFPQVYLVRNSTNLGYAKAVNQGFDLCHTEHVLLLNPDIRIPSPGLFAELEQCLRRSRQIAAVAPLQFKSAEKRHSLNFTWSYSTPKAFKVYLSYLLQRKQKFTAPVRVTLLNAGCLFLRRTAFEQVGGLNEKYFMYGEEPDLFLKFKRYGFECYLLPNSAITHYRERSLMTIPSLRRLQIKVHAIWNVMDAFITGWAYIALDRLVASKRQPGEERSL